MLRAFVWLSPPFFKKSDGDIEIASFPLTVSPSVCPLCYLLLNHWTKSNQIWCVSYWHASGVQRQTFLALPPGALGRGQKVKYHLISITTNIFIFNKIFIPNFVCVLINERYKKIVNEYDQEIPQSQTADNPVVPRGRAAQPSRDTRKTN